MKIIITSFEPFGGRSINASTELIKNINIKNIEKILLPVDYSKILPKISEIIDSNPDYLFLFGEAGSYKDITIEYSAHNIANGKDNSGNILNDSSIIEGAPYELNTKLNINASYFDFLESHDAGKYLCNYSYYLSLYKTLNKNTKVLFVHIPFIKEEGGSFELIDLINRIEFFLQSIIN